MVGGVVVGTFGSENGSKSQSRVRVEKYAGGDAADGFRRMGVAGAILVGFGSSLDGIGPHGVLGKESAGTSIQRQPQAAAPCA